jgi:hypothetical protein
VLLTIILVILALLLIRDLRREGQDDRILEIAQESRRVLEKVEAPSHPPDVILVGPGRPRSVGERLTAEARVRAHAARDASEEGPDGTHGMVSECRAPQRQETEAMEASRRSSRR